jgi:hypothetical protein
MGYALAFRRAYPFTSSFLNTSVMDLPTVTPQLARFSDWTKNDFNDLAKAAADETTDPVLRGHYVVQKSQIVRAVYLEFYAIEGKERITNTPQYVPRLLCILEQIGEQIPPQFSHWFKGDC